MADIKGRTIAATYSKLLYTSTDDGLEGNTGATTSIVTTDDGDGSSTASCLNLGIDRVGIGSTAPQIELHVNSAAQATAAALTYSVASGTIGNTNTLGVLNFGGKDNNQTLAEAYNAASIQCDADGSWGADDRGTMLRFNTTIGEITSTAMTIEKNGRVGIGVTDPSSLLEVESGDADCTLTISTGAVNRDSIIRLQENGSDRWRILNDADGHASGNNAFAIYDDGDERLCIEQGTGNVGIGTAAPGNMLEVAKVGQPIIELSAWSTTDAYSGRLEFNKSAADAVNTLGDTITGERLGVIAAAGVLSDDSTFKEACNILFEQDGSEDADSVPGRIKFGTSDLDDAGSPTTRMTILSDGNVGIGTPSPPELLSIKGTSDPTLQIHNSTGSNNETASIDFAFNSASANPHVLARIHCIVIDRTSGNEDGDIVFSTEAAGAFDERMRIDSTGNVGIGTSSPGTWLASGSSSATYLDVYDSAQPAVLSLGGNETSDAATVGIVQFINNDNADVANNDADGKIIADISVAIETDDSNAGDDCGGDMYFKTKPLSGSLATRMTIKDDGNVGIGTEATAPTSPLHIKAEGEGEAVVLIDNRHTTAVAGDKILECYFSDSNPHTNPTSATYIHFGHAGDTDVGSIKGVTDINTIQYLETSDYRFKNQEEIIPSALDKVSALKPYQFFWKDSKATKKSFGFFAHELAEICPDAVSGEKDAVKMGKVLVKDFVLDSDGKILEDQVFEEKEIPDKQQADYKKLVPILTAAIQELSAKVEALENNNQTGDSNNDEGNQGNNNAGEPSSESAGEDSGGAEGSGSDSSNSSDGESASSEPSSDDGNQGSGSIGSDASDDSAEGSGGDDSSGSFPEGEPSDGWTKEQLKAYMDAQDPAIIYNSGDTKQDLLDKIGASNEG